MVAITLIFKICSRLAARQIRREEARQLPDIPYTLINDPNASDDNDEEKGLKPASERKTHDGADLANQQPINDTCVICLEEFTHGQQVKVLPCKHGFHGDCIDPWLAERSDQCPICKQSVLISPDRRICLCIPVDRCRACCAANNGNLSPRVTQMIMLLVVAFLAVIVALFFLYPA
uniref:RING-type domain-containing protein n=2 Tax=Lotharella globosa TaxID=91324 RepID=A0A7S3YIF7_9EUKA